MNMVFRILLLSLAASISLGAQRAAGTLPRHVRELWLANINDLVVEKLQVEERCYLVFTTQSLTGQVVAGKAVPALATQGIAVQLVPCGAN